jgi:hypothetical protein
MPTTINASNTTGGAVVTGDGSGILELQSGGVTGITVNGPNVTVAGTITSTGGLASPVTVAGNSTAGAEIRLPEDTDNGSNYVAIKAPNALAANVTFTLPTADGTNGQYLQTNGSGQLAFATVAGNQITAVASGTIPTGASVILNADGTVSAVSGTLPGNGSVVTVGATTNYVSGVYDPSSGKVVVAYRNNSDGNGYAVVGTISGTTISFGTPVQFDASGNNLYNKACYITAQQRVVVVYRNTSVMLVIAGQVSGTSITFGTAANSGHDGIPNSLTEVSGQSRGVVSYYYTGAAAYAMYSFTVSGSTVSWTNYFPYDASGFTSYYFQMCTPLANKIILAYRDGNNAQVGTCYHYNVNSSTGVISLVRSDNFTGSQLNTFNMCGDPANSRFFLFYSDQSNGIGVALMRACAVGATTTTIGSPITITSSLTGLPTSGTAPFYNQDQNSSPTAIYISSGNRVYLAYARTGGPGILSGVVSGTGATSTISWDPGVASTFGTAGSNSISLSYAGVAGYAVLASSTSSSALNAVVTNIGLTTLTSINFAGFSAGSYTNGQTATVQTIGAVSTNVTGLTPAQKYYVLGDGSLSTTADTRNVYAGLATSATSILIKG